MPIEGVDYSAGGPPGSAALKAAGKHFAARYVVGDLSPSGRGITAEEYAELTSGGVEVVAVWEGTANRMQQGLAAGQVDAQDAVLRLANAGMPALMPVYFACDFDATPDDQAQIDAYLTGARAVVGADRVGIYGGFWIVSRCSANGTAKWFWQTSAWSGGNWFSGNHLEQYDYNVWIAGVNCDATRALLDNYGQASRFLHPAPAPAPAPAPTTGPLVDAHGVPTEATLAAWFGKVRPYNHHGPVSTAWREWSLAHGEFPDLKTVVQASDGVEYNFGGGLKILYTHGKAAVIGGK